MGRFRGRARAPTAAHHHHIGAEHVDQVARLAHAAEQGQIQLGRLLPAVAREQAHHQVALHRLRPAGCGGHHPLGPPAAEQCPAAACNGSAQLFRYGDGGAAEAPSPAPITPISGRRLLMPPPVPSPAAGSCRRSSPGSGL